MRLLKFLKKIGAISISDDMIDRYYRVSVTRERTFKPTYEMSLKDKVGQMDEQIAKLQGENECLRKNTEKLMKEVSQLRQDLDEIQEEKLIRDRHTFLEGIEV